MNIEPQSRVWAQRPKRVAICAPPFGFGFRPRSMFYRLGFNPASIADLTVWLDATDLTVGAGNAVTAINNKQGGTDPTISAGEEPTYTATNANYGNRPTWKCGTASGARVIRCTPAAMHGLGTGARTAVVVGQCKDANYALSTPSGLTNILGGGGSGNKWQCTSDAGNYLASGAGVADNPSVAIFVLNGASSKVYVNSNTATTGNTGSLENLSSSDVMIGNSGSPTQAAGQDGDTTQFLIYNRALTQSECEYLLAGFGAQAGITITP